MSSIERFAAEFQHRLERVTTAIHAADPDAAELDDAAARLLALRPPKWLGLFPARHDSATRHYAHTALGVAALRRGDVAGAKAQLREAGRIGPEPVFRSFGPCFVLARRLVEAGELAAVAAYLARVNRVFRSAVVQSWLDDLRRGAVPAIREFPDSAGTLGRRD